MTEPAETRSDVETKPPPRPHLRTKESTELRFRELLDERKQGCQRIADLERENSELRANLEARNDELVQFRTQRDGQQKQNPERIAFALEGGRKLFADFDAVIASVPDHQAFEAVLTSANGPELMYATGIGLKALGILRQFHGQAQADKERVEYYRKLHQQHFAGVNDG